MKLNGPRMAVVNGLKTLTRVVDKFVFNNLLTRNLFRRRIRRQVTISQSFIRRHQPRKNEFSILCDVYGSDKGSIKAKRVAGRLFPHRYSDFYWEHFKEKRFQIESVFECGIGTNNPLLASTMGINGRPGASLRVWRDFFPNAKVLGADIDSSILFDEERITTRELDQTNPNSIITLWDSLLDIKFDLMVDDGLHTFEAGSCLLTHSLHKLKSNGIYVVEDILPEDLALWDKFLISKKISHEWLYFGPFGARNFDLLLIARAT